MAVASVRHADEPLGAMNTTPLIDVMLVLLVMLIFTLPLATHSVQVDLPQKGRAVPNPLSNKVVVTEGGSVLWNGGVVSESQLLALLQETRRFPIEPELQFEPEANAGYELAARVLAVIKASGVTKFGFVGNERYGRFGAGSR